MGLYATKAQKVKFNLPKFDRNATIDYMNYDQAKQQSGEQLNPLYQNIQKEAQNQIKDQTMGNGMFGQPNQIQLSYDKAAEIENQKAAKTAEMARQLQDSDYARKSDEYNRAYQLWRANTDDETNRYNLDYQAYRDEVGDIRYNDERDYGRMRDKEMDTRYYDERDYTRKWQEDDRNWDRNWQVDERDYTRNWQADERDYARGRDSEMDSRYYDELNYNRDYQANRDSIADQRYSTEWDYKVGRDGVADKQWQDTFDFNKQEFNVNNGQVNRSNIIAVADKLGYVTPELAAIYPNLKVGTQFQSTKVDNANIALAKQEAANQERARQQQIAIDKQNASTKAKQAQQPKKVNMTTVYNNANKYFDSLPGDKFDDLGRKIPGVGTKTKAALKVEFKEALSRYSGPNGYAKFQQEKALIYKRQPDTAPFLINALENAFAYMS